MKKYSKNKKLNTLLTGIEQQLFQMCDTKKESLNEIKRYMQDFKNKVDYNLAQYGNLIIYYSDVRKFYKRCGYKSIDNFSDGKIWEVYKRQVGFVARKIITES